MRRLLGRLGIEPTEGRIFRWAAATLLLVGWADVSIKNVAETFFVKRVGVEALPGVFLVNSVLLVGTTYAIGRLAAGRDRVRMLPLVLVALGFLLVPLWWCVQADLHAVFYLLVIASKQIQSIALLMFFFALGDLLDAREAKRLLAPVTAGFTLGTVAGSFASEQLRQMFGIDGLLPISGATLGAAALCTLPLGRAHVERLGAKAGLGRAARGESARHGAIRTRAPIRGLWRRSGLFRILLVTTVCSGLLGPMLYFQFQFTAALATSRGEAGEQELFTIYAQFRGWIYAAVLLTQVGVASRFYRRSGIPLAVALSPVVYLLGFLGLSLRLSLPVGIAAMAGAKLQDNAIYDPGQRILFNLFPESRRASSTVLLEGPVKRAGGALGNLLVLGLVSVASAAWVGFAAIPICLVWLGAALVLWRIYPALLLQASRHRIRFGEDAELALMLDRTTLRALKAPLLDESPDRVRVAAGLVCEAEPSAAVSLLASAAREAPPATRGLLVKALDRMLERGVPDTVVDAGAARDVEALLSDPGTLDDAARADLVQAYARLSERGGELQDVLVRALEDRASAVRLAALAALYGRGSGEVRESDLDQVLELAVVGDDLAARRTARRELRALLLRPEPGGRWIQRLRLLASLLERPEDRAATGEALAEIALRHGSYANVVSDPVLALRGDSDPRVRSAVLRFCGYAALREQACWIVDRVASPDPAEERAAHDALIALGPHSVDVLLREVAYGRRSKRDTLLSIIRELHVRGDTLGTLYEREIHSSQRNLAHLFTLKSTNASEIVLQRLEERIGEGLHTALLFLAAIRDEDRIAEMAELMKRCTHPRQYAILVEALDADLVPAEKRTLLPMLEERFERQRGRHAASALGIPQPTAAEAVLALLSDTDELTRTLVAATEAQAEHAPLAMWAEVKDHEAVLSPVEIALHGPRGRGHRGDTRPGRDRAARG
jgi:AAA family ATP:ADP antiporter